ncbi:MAG: hypothetical protein HQL72_04180 [Magnetococcales bacterium]|nr:hypothetical protein [Magnetococcales bacterium]
MNPDTPQGSIPGSADSLKQFLENLIKDTFHNSEAFKLKPEVLTPLGLAKEYNIPTSTQAKARMTGDFIPFFRIGTAIRYRRVDCEKWIADRIQRSTAETVNT